MFKFLRTIHLKCTLLVLCLAAFTVGQAQGVRVALDWQKAATGVSDVRNPLSELPWFDGAFESEIDHRIPEFRTSLPVSSETSSVEVSLRNPTFVQIERPSWMSDELVPTEIAVNSELVSMRGANVAYVTVNPFIRRSDGSIERLVSTELDFRTSNARQQVLPVEFADHSKLASGTWYRVTIPRDGVYSLDRSFFQDLGVDVDQLDPTTINVYGSDAGLLPYQNSDYIYDDLQVKAIRFDGEDDGSFDSSDRIFFYAKGPDKWKYAPLDDEFKHTDHLYMDVAYCFIGIGVDAPVRMSAEPPVIGTPTSTVTSFDDHRFHEEDLESVIKSGRRMVGERFGLDQTLSYGGSVFSYENIDTSAPVKIRMRATVSTIVSNNFSYVECTSQGNTVSIPIQGSSNQYIPASSAERVLEFVPTNGNLSLTANFIPGGNDSRGWVDFIAVNVRRNLIRTSSQLLFRDIQSVEAGSIAEYTISNMTEGNFLWDVTDPSAVSQVSFDLQGSEAKFTADASTLREYALFRSSNVLAPGGAIAIANQDIHDTEQVDMVIVSAVPFMSTAEKVADLHRQEGLSVQVLDPQTIYNEFSCGMMDITAIKMYMKMLYDRAGTDAEAMPDYLLLIGDGNYDQSDIVPTSSIYLPSYQSLESNSLTASYISDDYFGLLDDDESEGGGALDIGIGRFPVRTLAEAEGVYAKIVRYISDHTGVVGGVCSEDAETTYGDWRNKVLVIGDDEDVNTHMNQANIVADQLIEVDEDFIVNKVFLDAYLQEITPGGARYPDAAEEVKRSIQEGVFLASYTGHGGEVGWAAERVLDIPTIQGFTNRNSLPLLLTATCEFSRYDDPDRVSAGELTLLNPDGGVIALLTTTRLVYSNPNFVLSKNFFDIVSRKDVTTYVCDGVGGSLEFDLTNGLRLGDIIRITKNCTTGSSTNKANFSLLGDPALRLTYPELIVNTDSIVGLDGAILDTLSALQRVKFYGHITRDGVVDTDFNGQVLPSLYDKSVNVETLANDGGGQFSFTSRKNILYKGRATVTDGLFSFEFIVPKDISYQEGNGKVYYYGLSDDTDAQGSYDRFQVGGSNNNAPTDEVGPSVELYLESEAFVDGDLTNEEPVLIAKIFDENGVNTVGNGIGHDIVAILDGNTSDPVVLNDYFQLDLDSYQKGELRYQFSELEEGDHTLKFKVWDIYNNSSIVEVSFKVKREENLSLANVVNYPNPFTTHTEFLFDHNQQACDALDVRVQVFTVSGKLVKTIHRTIDSHIDMRNQLVWDGRDEFGDRLGRGVYVYKLQVATPEGAKEEVFEKLVLL